MVSAPPTFQSTLTAVAKAIDAGVKDADGLVTVRLPASYARELRLAAECIENGAARDRL
jgi:hypothetical protein